MQRRSSARLAGGAAPNARTAPAPSRRRRTAAPPTKKKTTPQTKAALKKKTTPQTKAALKKKTRGTRRTTQAAPAANVAAVTKTDAEGIRAAQELVEDPNNPCALEAWCKAQARIVSDRNNQPAVNQTAPRRSRVASVFSGLSWTLRRAMQVAAFSLAIIKPESLQTQALVAGGLWISNTCLRFRRQDQERLRDTARRFLKESYDYIFSSPLKTKLVSGLLAFGVILPMYYGVQNGKYHNAQQAAGQQLILNRYKQNWAMMQSGGLR